MAKNDGNLPEKQGETQEELSPQDYIANLRAMSDQFAQGFELVVPDANDLSLAQSVGASFAQVARLDGILRVGEKVIGKNTDAMFFASAQDLVDAMENTEKLGNAVEKGEQIPKGDIADTLTKGTVSRQGEALATDIEGCIDPNVRDYSQAAELAEGHYKIMRENGLPALKWTKKGEDYGVKAEESRALQRIGIVDDQGRLYAWLRVVAKTAEDKTAMEQNLRKSVGQYTRGTVTPAREALKKAIASGDKEATRRLASEGRPAFDNGIVVVQSGDHFNKTGDIQGAAEQLKQLPEAGELYNGLASQGRKQLPEGKPGEEQ